ncbi:small, acid-soluble spore protein, alpha/beta type [Paenibacillus sp. GCM10023252]|uniref:small, acid-soluble spore protein, alpha/beta type n=1 Tax=Paenibacillus sp. GCM10023252 TaxID=3252649 RepID=UPI0036131096
MSRTNRTNKVVVPASKDALKQMKYEIAAEFGLYTPAANLSGMDTEFAGDLGSIGGSAGAGRVHWDEISTRQAGSVGGEITKRLIQQAEKVLGGY